MQLMRLHQQKLTEIPFYLFKGVIPDNKLNVGALQDTMSFNLDLYKCFKGLSVFQGCVKKPSDFVHIFEKTNDFLSKKNRVSGPVHLQISIDSFPASVSKGVFFPQLDEPDCLLTHNYLALLRHSIMRKIHCFCPWPWNISILGCVPEIEAFVEVIPDSNNDHIAWSGVC